jgi:hypothetical protein
MIEHPNENITCPKFNRCDSPICPLDKDWRKRTNTNEDTTCYYLIESIKSGAEERFKRAQLEGMYQLIVSIRGDISSCFKRIARKLQLASKTSSRMERRFKL